MKPNNISYPNLRAEMGRKNINICKMAQMLGMNRDTLSRRLSNHTDIPLDMAMQIREAIFPECGIQYLFEKEA